jgi:hypothetical protein
MTHSISRQEGLGVRLRFTLAITGSTPARIASGRSIGEAGGKVRSVSGYV